LDLVDMERMAKKVVLTTVGSLGDLHPFIAVALALRARGFGTVIAAAEEYRSKVENEGLAFAAVRPSTARVSTDSQREYGELVADVAKSRFSVLIDAWITPYIEETYADLIAVMTGADLVAASTCSIVARLAQAKLGLPSVSLLLSPACFLSAVDPPVSLEAPWLQVMYRWLGPRGVRVAHALGQFHLRLHTRGVSQFRQRLGLRPVRGDEVLGEPLCADWVALPFSPLLASVPADAPKTASVVGFSFYDSEAGGSVSLTKSLERFLADGPAPLVFGLGSAVAHAASDFYDKAVAAARHLGMHAVLLVGPDGVARLQRLASSKVFVAGYVPHSLVFRHAAVVIHQGSIGTVGQAMRAGRPQLICPYLGDQADNAERLVKLGVGRRLDLKQFTTARAVAAITELLAADVTANAAALAPGVASEDGASVVAERIAWMLVDDVKETSN
jgi:rhamnosyltransferase subunit B